MKKYLKIIIYILIFIINVNVVHAITCEELQLYAQEGFWTHAGLYMNYGNNEENNYSIYTLKDNNGSAFASYCRNAGLNAGNKHAGETFYCDHKVFDATSDDETIKMYDAGIVAILKNGYSSSNSSGGNREYAATTIALRAYEMLWPDLNTNGALSVGLNNAHKYYVNLWLDDINIRNLLNATMGYYRNKFNDAIKVNYWKDSNGTDITTQIHDRAYRLVRTGLEAAKYYKENGAASIKGVDDKPLIEKTPAVVDRDGIKNYETSLTYTFTAEKFKSQNAYIKIGFECENCSRYRITPEIQVTIDGKTINYYEGINLKSYLNDGTGEIKYKIILRATSEYYNCEQLKYKLNLEWKDDTISTEAFDLYSKSCTSNIGCQHFYMLYATDVPTKKTIEDTAELCSLTCKELEASCKNGNATACVQFRENYPEGCADCTTYIENPECSNTETKIDVNEGYDIDVSNCNNITEKNNLNVLQCVIDNSDPAGNSYEATKLIQNDYCKVFCKEDYHFVLPGVKEANSGRYFSLSASIKGTKTCYSNKIDKELFDEDILEAQKKLIEAYNDYMYYYMIVNTTEEEYDASYRTNCECVEDEKNPNRNVSGCNTGQKCDRDTDYCTFWKKEFSYTEYDPETTESYTVYYDDDVDVGTHSHGALTWGKTVSCNCNNKKGDEKCEPGKTLYEEENYPSKLERAKKSVESAIKAYKKVINKYNLCSGLKTARYDTTTTVFEDEPKRTDGWKMDYKYSPTVSFWYEESYMNNVLTDTLGTIGSTSTYDFKQKYCTIDTDRTYTECETDEGWETYLDFDESRENKFVCYSSTENKSNDGPAFTCGSLSLVISNVKYIKQEMKSKGEYITPTQFYQIYPSGAIVVAETGKQDEIENSKELTNLLPVGLGTPQGVYTYTLKVTDLGEYYNNNKLGRIWGDRNSVVVNILEEAKDGTTCTKDGALQSNVKVNGNTIKDGVYVCSYKVNCPDCPVECDESGCKNPNCPSGNCPVECENCIYTNGSENFTYKPISPGNVNPSDRVLGVNWKYDDNSISTALELKAYATTKEIEEKGETIYDVDYENTSTDVDRNFAIHLKLDSRMINKIREYNDRYENNGGYANNSLKCYDYTQNGVVYDNIYCYSTFIDELLYDDNTKNNIQIIGNRIIGENASSSDTLRKTQTQSSGYWTTWAEANSNKWTITTTNGLAYYRQNYSEIGIGPSWK